MLYVFHGTDPETARTKLRELVHALLTKKPDAEQFRLDAESFSDELLKEYVSSKGLFAQSYIVVLDHVFADPDAGDVVLKAAADLEASDNIFLILEGALPKKALTKLEKHAAKVQKYGDETKKKKQVFNIFSLTDLLGAKKKRDLWIGYHKARRAGVAPEEIHGVLFWQLKTILLVSREDTKGLKPFSVTKAQRFLTHYTKDEVAQKLTELVTLYHTARAGGLELELALEDFILRL